MKNRKQDKNKQETPARIELALLICGSILAGLSIWTGDAWLGWKLFVLTTVSAGLSAKQRGK